MAQMQDEAAAKARAGLFFGVGAYSLWGLLPIYFKLLAAVPAVAIVAHRVCWSILVLGALVAAQRGAAEVRAALSRRGTVLLLMATSVLIGINWLVYVYAINSGHILAGSLGYYLNPIANILLGYFILKEPLSRLQWVAVGIAGAGVVVLAADAGPHLWISLTLCVSFSLYGLLRKIAHVEATAGLAIETALLFPLALTWLILSSRSGAAVWGSTSGEVMLLVGSGIASTIPLLFFTAAARRLPYSTLGILQFLAPTLQFLVAVFLFGEDFTQTHAIAFGAIWTAAILYLISAWQSARAPAIECLPE